MWREAPSGVTATVAASRQLEVVAGNQDRQVRLNPGRLSIGPLTALLGSPSLTNAFHRLPAIGARRFDDPMSVATTLRL